jgi:hypothetical protein
MPDLVWVDNPEGKPHEQYTVRHGITITIYSDPDGEVWMVQVGDSAPIPLEATEVDQARREALIT